MAKFDAGKVSLLVLVAVLSIITLITLLLGKTLTSVFANYDGHHYVWQTTGIGDYGSCVPNANFNTCEGGAGTETRTLYQTCTKVEGKGSDQCSFIASCKKDYTLHNNECEKQSYKYDKPQCDDNYSYDSSKSWSKSCIRKDRNPKSASCDRDYQHVVENGVDKCRKTETDKEDPTYTPQTQEIQDTAPCTIPANPDACPVQCTANASPNNNVCICDPGYHEVNSDEVTVVSDSITNFTCEADTPTPAPTSTPTENSGGGSAGAPVCNATKPGTPTITSAVQNGTSVTLTWSSVPNATYYSIVYGNLPGYQYGVANVGNVTTYTIHSLAPGVVYHFAVNAVNDCMPGDPGTFGGGTGGQVLGASTMAGTGSFEENLYLAIMGIGGTITAFGLKNIKKAFKVVK
jgi:hypothetical protein